MLRETFPGMSGEEENIHSDFSDNGFEDGTTAKKVFPRVVVSGEPKAESGKSSSLRLREKVGIPDTIARTRVVRSGAFYNKGSGERHADLSENTDDERSIGSSDAGSAGSPDEDDASSDETSYMSTYSGRPGVLRVDPSADLVDEPSDRHGPSELFSVSRDLLEEQRTLEEELKQEQFMLERKDEKERERLQRTAKHMRNQVTVWSSLLACRIHFQQILTRANQLPVDSLSGSDESLSEARRSVAKLLGSFRSLQHSLVEGNVNLAKYMALSVKSEAGADATNGSKDSARFKRQRKREQLVETNPAISREDKAWNIVDGNLKRLKEWSFSVADHWHSKTHIFPKQQFKVLDQAPSAQVARAMDSELTRLLEKTLVQNTGSGAAEQTGYCETYEDTNFYVGLLRDTISTNAFQNQLDSNLSLDAVAAQAFSKRLKQRDAADWRREVERRASKGRKIRYTPIPALVGFMSAEPQSFSNEMFGCLSDDKSRQEALINAMVSSLFRPKHQENSQ